jgi:hypothetical protein
MDTGIFETNLIDDSHGCQLNYSDINLTDIVIIILSSTFIFYFTEFILIHHHRRHRHQEHFAFE